MLLQKQSTVANLQEQPSRKLLTVDSNPNFDIVGITPNNRINLINKRDSNQE